MFNKQIQLQLTNTILLVKVRDKRVKRSCFKSKEAARKENVETSNDISDENKMYIQIHRILLIWFKAVRDKKK